MNTERSTPQRVYFDAHHWNHFAEPENSPHPEGAYKRVQRAQEVGRIEVVGSLDLLQELIAARREVPRKAGRMLDQFFQLVRERLLLPLSERQPAEAIAGGVLPKETCYVSRELQKDVRRFAQSGRDTSELIEELYKEKVSFQESEQRVQQKMTDRLAKEGATKHAPLMRKWINSVDISEWVREIAEDPRLRKRVPNYQAVCPEHLPSASAFVAARLGLLALTMGEGRRIEASDLADAQHVACGPYIDVLITDDKKLRATLDLIQDRISFRYPSQAEFFATLP